MSGSDTMAWRLVACLMPLLAIFIGPGCKTDESPVVANFLFATPHDITMAMGTDTTVLLSGGTRPYILLQSPKANIAAVELRGDTILIHAALSTGSDHIKAGDSSPSQNTALVSLVVTADVSIVQ